MATKTESPPSGKLSPSERLARKRAAARLRQQRCRARKREAMLEQRRHQDSTPQGPSPQDSRAEPVRNEAQGRNPPNSFPCLTGSMSSSPRDPIYNCVSFDSQRSFDEAQRAPPALISRNSSEQGSSTAPSSPSSTGKPVEVITIPLNQPEEPLVAKEEAAIAAMLSLKSSDSPKSSPPSSPRKPEESRHPIVPRLSLKPTQFRYYRDWEAPPRYGYGRHAHGPPPPPYYGMAMPHRGTPPQYRYYPAYKNKSYSRFDYE